MRPVRPTVHSIVVGFCFVVAGVSCTQPPAIAQTATQSPAQTAVKPPAASADTSHPVTNGGIFVPGWQGKVDPSAAAQGLTVNDARFAPEAGGFHITTGPAITYWTPSDQASGDYVVSATFTEAQYMNRNSHPHPYGIFIGGNALASPNPTLLYCAAYGNGTFIVRGFGPEPFQMNGRRGEANPAVHKASGPGQSVTQKIEMSVIRDKVTCTINGTIVANYNKSDVVAPGKLKSTDGVYGIRFAHNTDGIVTDLKVTKP